MADQDSYQYQPIPLPQRKVIGDQAYDATQVSVDPTTNVPGPAVDPTDSPFGPTVAPPFGGGSAVPTPTSCLDDILANTLSTSVVAFPCTDPTGSISNPGIVLTNDADPAVDWLKVQYADMSLTDDVLIQLNELDVCHMGVPGKRKFVCGDAYAP